MLHVARPSEFQFSGNVTNIPGVLQPSSTCQWFRLLTVRCQRLAHQPIVFCVVRPTRISLALAKWAVSLFLLGLPPSFRASRGFAARARVCIPPTKPEEKERLLAVYGFAGSLSFFVPLPSRAISLARGHSRVSRFARRTTEKRETARSLGFSRLINFMPFSQNSPANQHNQHVQPTASTPTSTILQVSSVARNLCKEGNRDHLTMRNHHNVNSC